VAGLSGAEPKDGAADATPAGVVERTKKFEGTVPHMYLDKEGNVTAGVGLLVGSAAAAADLDFVHKSDGKAATAEERRADWKAIHEAEKGHAAAYYDKVAKLKLPDSAVDELLKKDLEKVVGGLKAKFPDYEKYPAKAQAGLIDMAFNLGVQGLVDRFPKF
jgi:GH24 family phage-related lysozyme (muramidase)